MVLLQLGKLLQATLSSDLGSSIHDTHFQMYLFLPHVITTYSGKTFQEFVTERIFVPLNMTATTYNLTAADESGLMSQSFIFTGRRIPVIFQDPRAASFIAGAGGVISNAIDMVS